MSKEKKKRTVTLETLRTMFNTFDTLECRARYKQQKDYVPYATTALVRNWDNVNTITLLLREPHMVMTPGGWEGRDGATFVLDHNSNTKAAQ